MSKLERVKEKFNNVIREIADEKGTPLEDVQKKLAEIEDEISELNDTNIDIYLSDLLKENPDDDIMNALRQKMWKSFFETKHVSLSIYIEFNSEESLDKYEKIDLSLNNRLVIPSRIKPNVLHLSVMAGQETRLRKELQTKILPIIENDVKNIRYNHIDGDVHHNLTR